VTDESELYLLEMTSLTFLVGFRRNSGPSHEAVVEEGVRQLFPVANGWKPIRCIVADMCCT